MPAALYASYTSYLSFNSTASTSPSGRSRTGPLLDAACTARCNVSVVLLVSRLARPYPLCQSASPSSRPLQCWPLHKAVATNIGLAGQPGEAIPVSPPAPSTAAAARTGIDIATQGDTTDALDERSVPYHMLNRARILLGGGDHKCKAPTQFGRLIEERL